MQRKILTVHAHPDDEVSRGGATIAHYTAQGVQAVLVTCTDGAAGEILNPDFGTLPEGRTLAAQRAGELAASARVLGYSTVHSLGWADSGFDGAAGGDDAFVKAPVDVAAERLAVLVEKEKPQVIIGYGTNHTRDPHPDHIRANQVLTRCVELLGERGAIPLPDVFHVAFSRRRHQALHEACLTAGVASPYAPGLSQPDSAFDDAEINTVIPLSESAIDRRLAALRCHRTQIAPNSGWFALSSSQLYRAYPYDEYIRVAAGPGGHRFDDLFVDNP
ncbi:PIG-L family deacetylase [Streptomyces sp.]|uniref:PIG-L family deacetylase n=1 Tax=Streptomyces sp. TaxID=1931 RepID=UPI002CB2F824|nr:PIG-L family deacetylase [Streptomyces sp.]HLL34747.1 PIG-L family deacetylase [Streptomyces sp.]HZF86900.1 PIG-L family deacetylase [Streptomyces sp.]